MCKNLTNISVVFASFMCVSCGINIDEDFVTKHNILVEVDDNFIENDHFSREDITPELIEHWTNVTVDIWIWFKRDETLQVIDGSMIEFINSEDIDCSKHGAYVGCTHYNDKYIEIVLNNQEYSTLIDIGRVFVHELSHIIAHEHGFDNGDLHHKVLFPLLKIPPYDYETLDDKLSLDN